MQKIKDYIYYNRKEIIVVSIILIFLISYIFLTSNEKQNFMEEEKIIKDEPKEEKSIVNEIVIDIKGEIKSPGTYKLLESERVIDAINKAGGLKNNADTTNINLSEKVYDEMVIYIPTKEETNNNELKTTYNNIVNSNKKDNNKNNNKNSNKQISDGKISINNADINELMTIKGIGETKAQRIIEYRNNNGRFNSIEEITNISGIGKTTFEKIKNYIKI